MMSFNGGGKRFGGGAKDRGRGFGGGDRGGRPFAGRGFGGGQREMYDAVCAECSKGCKVPFMPIGDKPVYCSECFGGKDGGRDSDRRPGRGFGGGFGGDRGARGGFERKNEGGGDMDRQFREIKEKLNKLQEAVDILVSRQDK